jgi:hypothetical protein
MIRRGRPDPSARRAMKVSMFDELERALMPAVSNDLRRPDQQGAR